MRTILFSFLLPCVSFCCMHLYFMFTAVSYQMFFHWCSFMYLHWGFWNKPLDLLLLLLLLQSMPTPRPPQRKNLPRHQRRAPQRPPGTNDRSSHPSQQNQPDHCMKTLSWQVKPHLRNQLRTEPRLHRKGKQPSHPEDREKVARGRTVVRKRSRMCTTTKTSTRATVPSGPCLYWTPFRNTCWTV